MLDWKVLEGEEVSLPPGEITKPIRPRRGHWLLWLLGLFLLLVGLVAGGLWWRVREHEQLIRAQLTEFIEAEARVMAVGDPMQMRPFLDPQASSEWRTRYEILYGWSRPYVGLPALEEVRLENKGTLALVTVSWPAPVGGEKGGREERRAYRMVEGGWRRTAYPIPKVELSEQRSPHFVLRAPPGYLGLWDELNLENFYQHIAERWPDEWQNEPHVTIIIEPEEFALMGESSSLIRTTSPEFSWFEMTSPLSARTQYRVRLMSEVLDRVIEHQPPPPLHLSRQAIISAEQYRMLFYILLRAEEEHWILDEGQRRHLRNRWREQMAGTWRSPFERSLTVPDGASAEDVENAGDLRQANLYFLIDYLIATEGRAIPGQLAQQMAATSLKTFDLATAVRAVTDKPLEQLEAEARDFALLPEP
ncbi:MAG: hypothetical protein H0T73_20040 [Ardenticatenales bacterium]|nr:hypothetical protein [Ardenticatenales bacterium]